MATFVDFSTAFNYISQASILLLTSFDDSNIHINQNTYFLFQFLTTVGGKSRHTKLISVLFNIGGKQNLYLM